MENNRTYVNYCSFNFCFLAWFPSFSVSDWSNPEGSIIDIAVGIHYSEITFFIIALIFSFFIYPLSILGPISMISMGLLIYKIARREVIDFLGKMLM